CVAALLPYTAGEGAKAFAESKLKMAQEELIPAICRIYTYPSAWYFEDDKGNPPSSNGNGNGHSNGNGNGDGLNRRGGDLKSPGANGNGNGHAKSNGNGNGHYSGNGNGNGNGHAKANGNGNGHPIAMGDEGETAVA